MPTCRVDLSPSCREEPSPAGPAACISYPAYISWFSGDLQIYEEDYTIVVLSHWILEVVAYIAYLSNTAYDYAISYKVNIQDLT